jgi:hypothetical protein
MKIHLKVLSNNSTPINYSFSLSLSVPESTASATNLLPPQEIPPEDTTANFMRWDFREGNLPLGVEVVGGEPEFQLQKDGSTALFLPPMAFLKVSASSGAILGASF